MLDRKEKWWVKLILGLLGIIFIISTLSAILPQS
jgi:hypothetical protein